MLQALIFDVDGTLADTEMAHLAAFNHAFAEVGLDWHWDVPLYTRLLEVSGGKERIRAHWTERGDMPQDIGDGNELNELIAHIHELKTAAYTQAVQAGQVQLRPGVLALLSAAADAGLRLAIATTTSPVNISHLLQRGVGSHWQRLFAVVEDAATAPRKKPHPQVYQQALQRLGLPAANALAFEDSANGLRAASAAGLATVVTPNAFTAHHDFTGALQVLPSLQSLTLAQLHQWNAMPSSTTSPPARGTPPCP